MLQAKDCCSKKYLVEERIQQNSVLHILMPKMIIYVHVDCYIIIVHITNLAYYVYITVYQGCTKGQKSGGGR